MSLWQWLFGTRDRPSKGVSADPLAVRITVSTGEVTSSLVKISGTTTHGAQAVSVLAERRQIVGRGMLQEDAILQREPDNPVDGRAVAVRVEGERIGYLPRYAAQELQLDAGAGVVVPMQMFFVARPGGVRGEGWLWLGDGPAQWAFSESSPPPLTTAEKRADEHHQRQQMVADAIAAGGDRAAQFQAGMVDGVHYLELVEPIKQLKREGQLKEALRVCYRAIEGAEADRQGRMPAPWYTEQAAIIHRKLGDRQGEIEVLERWLRHASEGRPPGGRLVERLDKLRG